MDDAGDAVLAQRLPDEPAVEDSDFVSVFVSVFDSLVDEPVEPDEPDPVSPEVLLSVR